MGLGYTPSPPAAIHTEAFTVRARSHREQRMQEQQQQHTLTDRACVQEEKLTLLPTNCVRENFNKPLVSGKER
ncbi:unnamed protein product [Pleuronectes platessa]|uniref:Uncharacterized protein n=1 Tax=Pleuronectes platessa TaxID=8262 RepID=A0A9N7VXQ6_PLEPL|nr:unnamed protein product [Pleuronectes platessa]